MNSFPKWLDQFTLPLVQETSYRHTSSPGVSVRFVSVEPSWWFCNCPALCLHPWWQKIRVPFQTVPGHSGIIFLWRVYSNLLLIFLLGYYVLLMTCNSLHICNDLLSDTCTGNIYSTLWVVLLISEGCQWLEVLNLMQRIKFLFLLKLVVFLSL